MHSEELVEDALLHQVQCERTCEGPHCRVCDDCDRIGRALEKSFRIFGVVG